MKPRVIFLFLSILPFLLCSACQITDQPLEEDPLKNQQTPDRPFRPLQITLSAPQDGSSPDSLAGMAEDAPSIIRPTLTGDHDPVVTSSLDALLSAINIRRALEGWPPLIRQATLTEIANNRAIDLSVRAYLGHEDPETSEILVESMLIDMGYHGQVAELVYAANEPLDRLSEIAIEQWFDDPDTRSVLLSPGFNFIGIGMKSDGTTWKIVQVLAEHGP